MDNDLKNASGASSAAGKQNMSTPPAVPKRILASLIASVSAGVVPRSGAPYIAIGRKEEIAAFLSDLELVSDGGGAVRFLIGRYGSGKSFLMQLIRGYALERDFVCADADLSPERRLYGTGGTGLATYRELMKNLSVRTSPDGGGLSSIIGRLVYKVRTELEESGEDADSVGYGALVASAVRKKLSGLEALVGGFDFARVVAGWYEADVADDSDRKSACMRWLRGEFANKTEAIAALGFRVSEIRCDSNWYDYLKLWAGLSSTVGYRGMIVFIDECVNLYKIPHRTSRENNYEKILSIFNDTLQGRAPHLEIVFGGTPQFLEDTRRGLFGYEALRSRLCDTRFASEGYRNLAGPVMRLSRLSDDELFALTVRMTALHGAYYGWEPRITPDQLKSFLEASLGRAGAGSMMTPREMLRDLMSLLDILRQNPDAGFDDLVKTVKPAFSDATGGDPDGASGAGSEGPGGGTYSSGGAGASGKTPVDPADIDF